MAVSTTRGVVFIGVLMMRAIRAPDSWKLIFALLGLRQDMVPGSWKPLYQLPSGCPQEAASSADAAAAAPIVPEVGVGFASSARDLGAVNCKDASVSWGFF